MQLIGYESCLPYSYVAGVRLEPHEVTQLNASLQVTCEGNTRRRNATGSLLESLIAKNLQEAIDIRRKDSRKLLGSMALELRSDSPSSLVEQIALGVSGNTYHADRVIGELFAQEMAELPSQPASLARISACIQAMDDTRLLCPKSAAIIS